MINKITPKVITSTQKAEKELAELSKNFFRRDYIINDNDIAKAAPKKIDQAVEYFNPRGSYPAKESQAPTIDFLF
jgi:hypothetical protein